MGTGTPTVASSSLSAVNALFRKPGRVPFSYDTNMEHFLRIIDKPFKEERRHNGYGEASCTAMSKTRLCRFCEHPACSRKVDMSGIVCRVAAGNFACALVCQA